MARITDYPSLATAVQTFLGSANFGVSSGNLDYMVSDAEEEMNTRLRVRRMLTSLTPTVSATGAVTLPTDFAGWKRFAARDGTNEWDLDLKPAELVTEVTSLYNGTGRPQALIQNGSTGQILPYTNSGYTFAALYFARVPQLTSVNTTNWVITTYPNAYLYGCLAAAARLVADMQPAQASIADQWQRMFTRALDRIKREDALDLDARTNAILTPDTTLFSGGGTYDVLTDRSS